MKRFACKLFAVTVAVLFLSATALEISAHARAGGSRSMGSRGSRSYSRPASPSPQAAPSRQQQAAPGAPAPQPAGGGFLRSMAGGLVGGMLGGMLFRSLGFSGMGGGMGGGIGMFEILLLAGIAYLIYRFIKKGRENSSTSQPPYQGGTVTPLSGGYQPVIPEEEDVQTGLNHIQQFDPSFDEVRFNDLVMDDFFKIQSAWMNRDLSTVAGLMTDEMRRIMQSDIDTLIRNKQINRLENIAVRNVEITAAWQESGQDYITTLIYANLLDYTTDDSTGTLQTGSKTDPVKFEEFWTFTRPVGNTPWRLSAIDQK